ASQLKENVRKALRKQGFSCFKGKRGRSAAHFFRRIKWIIQGIRHHGEDAFAENSTIPVEIHSYFM
ncbi:MAG: hypothetical protein NC419_09295, partial [Muribaculaceae bacterium]|nr:hypothetical protein [Muribaculaceae bacterium]